MKLFARNTESFNCRPPFFCLVFQVAECAGTTGSQGFCPRPAQQREPRHQRRPFSEKRECPLRTERVLATSERLGCCKRWLFVRGGGTNTASTGSYAEGGIVDGSATKASGDSVTPRAPDEGVPLPGETPLLHRGMRLRRDEPGRVAAHRDMTVRHSMAMWVSLFIRPSEALTLCCIHEVAEVYKANRIKDHLCVHVFQRF